MALALRKAGSPPPPAGRPPFSWDCTQAAPLPATLFGSARGPMVRSPVPFTRPRPQWPPVGMSASAKCRSPLLPSWGPSAPQGLGLEHGGSGLGPGRGACAGKAGGAASRLVAAWSLGGAAGQWAAVLSEGRAWRRERVCACARSVRMGRRGPEPLLPRRRGRPAVFHWLRVSTALSAAEPLSRGHSQQRATWSQILGSGGRTNGVRSVPRPGTPLPRARAFLT